MISRRKPLTHLHGVASAVVVVVGVAAAAAAVSARLCIQGASPGYEPWINICVPRYSSVH